MAPSIMTFGIMTLIIMAFRIMEISIKGHFVTLSIPGSQHNDIRHKDIENNNIGNNGIKRKGFICGT
jgi:hypothetical protein